MSAGAAARLLALAAVVAFAVAALLTWQGPPSPSPASQDFGGGGVLNLLNTYSTDHVSGWHTLGWVPVACLALAAVGTLAALPAALWVCAIALIVLVVRVADVDGDVRWPAYAGVAAAVVLTLAAAGQVRARRGG